MLFVIRRVFEYRKYVNNLHMYFLPLANPDGYTFSRRRVGENIVFCVVVRHASTNSVQFARLFLP